ncbi:MAG: hypothetical protein ABIT58_10040 [Ferruginibacter sp.]
MKKAIFALFSICLIAVSCKKSDPDPVAPVNQPFYNSVAGSNWIYEVRTQDPTTLDTIVTYDTSRVTSLDTSIGSKVYDITEHNNGTHSYYNVTGNDYYQFQHVVIPATLDTSIEALYLKDNGAVGTNWSQQLSVNAGLPFPITITFASSIAETGLTKVVYGTTYNDVISVTTTLNAPGITINSNIKNYYARNIGLIQADYYIDIPGVTTVNNQTLLKFADPR